MSVAMDVLDELVESGGGAVTAGVAAKVREEVRALRALVERVSEDMGADDAPWYPEAMRLLGKRVR